MSKQRVGIGRLALAFAALLTVLAVSGPSRADDDWGRWNQWNNGRHDDRDHGNWGHGNDGWNNNWRHGNDGWGNNWRHGNDGWGNNWRHYNNRYPAYVYVRPRPYYYPQPYYYDYYGRPSFNFIIPLHID